MRGKEAPSDIKAIILYGSHARGDADRNSDVDVCVLTGQQTTVSENQLTSLAPLLLVKNFVPTVYCESDLAAMLKYGSLFLWHLKLEGRILYGEEYVTNQLDKLQPFLRHHAEIDYHSTLLADLLHVWSTTSIPNEFDLSLLFTIVRNTCMILAHKAGRPVFGRLACYSIAADMHPTLPLDEETYLKLSNWKSVYERGANINGSLPSQQEMIQLIERVQHLLDFADAKTT